MPVFFIQDAIKFPDLIHAAKPEPHREIPQAQSAHNNFWDFMYMHPEATHMYMWAMSDRAIPRSFRMMQGFGVNTFTLQNARGERHLVKFHWTPELGVHSLVWDEALKIAGQDPDFHRRDLADAIDAGVCPKWKFGIQVIPDDKADDFDFDVLDATKVWPQELVPIRYIGALAKMGRVTHYVREAFGHLKTVAATGEAVDLVRKAVQLDGVRFSGDGDAVLSYGVVTLRDPKPESLKEVVQATKGAKHFLDQLFWSVSQHRCWDRELDGLAAQVAY